ncbi:putative mitochondrial carrier domain protein [Arabidopsis thaliana]|jgi:solute carrier family 25 iron transporter 28/37|uniref:At1g07030 n=4 Tax=Arabidopsis TaxID=3701 RepID=Q8L6Z2_ARATH|nr:Mitochondrial substrate carrier family protein [Arabidopsis thaliana]KAG7596120.1 Mitochondrial substrate/solute carrier [Arabidopsis suecica]KAG7645385.1 Mitochondrial substrate/solute carrier [Arabidopsis thaliana x Arabidopsis arenosa]AAM98208.1 mitochondrial carrier protein, putative [Arabidopsis thaliana]AAP42736.1 At1g07030 [Arabidopsis thaliana]AEE28070.1 Mitochondrial substrate carrier family protein [Arabidopsis thaliana]|eukprot:NP_172184.1 Mitochondrial substrate carrier family protein [Arabidopsis thaliana]
MATEATTVPKFQEPDLRQVSQTPDFKPEIAHDGLKFWQFMIAGSIAGSVEHMAMFPVDTIKTHMQALRPCPLKPVGIREAFRSIIQKEGPSALYRGIWAMGLGAGPAHAVYFSFYEVSKKYLSAGDQNNSVAHAMSGVFATISSDAVFTPMDMVKQRLQMGEGTYKGVWDCVKRVLREEGIGAFYASYRTTVLMNAPFTAVHFATYEAAKKGLMEFSPDRISDEEGWLVHATAGAAAGGLAAAVTTPLDVVKTQLQCQGVCGCDRFTSSSISHVLRTIVKKDGYRGLLRGWLPRMLFHAPAAAICWSTYEGVKSFFQDFNVDSNTA